MISRRILFSLLLSIAFFGANDSGKSAVAHPWNQWIEPEFPFFSANIDGRSKTNGNNLTPRALVFPLGENHYLAYDLDLLRVAVAWEARDVPFVNASMSVNSYPYQLKKVGGGQGTLPKPNGEILFENEIYQGMGVGSPDFTDMRPPQPTKTEVGRGGINPKSARFKGINFKRLAEIECTVGNTLVRERFHLEKNGITRHLEVLPHVKPLYFVLAKGNHKGREFLCRGKASVKTIKGHAVCMIPPSRKKEQISIVFPLTTHQENSVKPLEKRWNKTVRQFLDETKNVDALNFEQIPLPLENPSQRAVRAAGIDFFKDGKLALVTFDGDVWMCEGLRPGIKKVEWSRFTSGLHEPLGLRIRDDEIFVFDRNGLWRLHDRDNNGEADYHELFCSQIDQTAETREFASAIEVEKDGSFLVCKPGQTGSTIGRSSSAILRVSPDGKTVTRVAHGFRQPYLGYDPQTGQIAASDQQGHYVPSTPIDFVRKGAFYGFIHEASDKQRPVTPPLAWIPHGECGSAGGIIWLRNARMGPLNDKPILLSFNPPRLFQIHPDVDEFVTQGGVTPLPMNLQDPLLKAAINPQDGLLYLTGFNIWGTSAKGKTFLGRVRTNQDLPWTIPTMARVEKRGILLRFATDLDPEPTSRRESYTIRRWNYKRTAGYGSAQYKLDGSKGTETLPIASVKMSRDKRSVFLGIPDMREVMQIEVSYKISSKEKKTPIENKTFLTAHLLRKLSLEKHGFANDQVELEVKNLPKVELSPPMPTMEKGKAIYVQLGCVACHSIDGSREGKTGPSWRGLYGSERKLTKTGDLLIANNEYLRESILNPAAKIAEGAVNGEAGMPIYEGVLNQEQVDSIILYIKSLKGKKAP